MKIRKYLMWVCLFFCVPVGLAAVNQSKQLMESNNHWHKFLGLSGAVTTAGFTGVNVATMAIKYNERKEH